MKLMPTTNEYSLSDLADLAGITPRTVRYYVAQGLLPSPGQVGPGTHYTAGHLDRLRLIRRLQREHLPLAEIRVRLEPLDDDAIADLLGAELDVPAENSAIDYIRTLLARSAGTERGEPAAPPGPLSSGPSPIPRPAMAQIRPLMRQFNADFIAEEPESYRSPPPPTPDRSQWDRIALTPDIELHVRRPLSRRQHKQVDRLIAIGRELLEGESS